MNIFFSTEQKMQQWNEEKLDEVKYILEILLNIFILN